MSVKDALRTSSDGSYEERFFIACFVTVVVGMVGSVKGVPLMIFALGAMNHGVAMVFLHSIVGRRNFSFVHFDFVRDVEMYLRPY